MTAAIRSWWHGFWDRRTERLAPHQTSEAERHALVEALERLEHEYAQAERTSTPTEPGSAVERRSG